MHVEDMKVGDFGFVRPGVVIRFSSRGVVHFAIGTRAVVLQQHLTDEILLARTPEKGYVLHIPKSVRDTAWNRTTQSSRGGVVSLTPKYM